MDRGYGARCGRGTPLAQSQLAGLARLLLRASRLREDLPVAQIVKRDPKDDPIVSAAIACRCAFLVSYDPHLLRLEKPYGVQCVTPRSFLSIVLRES
jgi:predicted nucleic acid-binding protein